MQLAELREYAGRRGWQIVEEFTDQGISGCKESRPALNRLMSDACRRRFDAVLVWKIDRFGRSLKHLVNALAELAALGVAFISLRDNLDLSTPSGRLMFQIIGAMAEFERALIQERVRAGIRNARAKGRRLGRPRVIVDNGPTPEELVKWMSDPQEIDRRLKGTEHAHLIDPRAHQQRAGVLGSLGLIADSLRLLPKKGEGNGEWSATEWAETRQGWIFITSLPAEREALQPLQSLWIDLLVLRLLNEGRAAGNGVRNLWTAGPPRLYEV